MTRAVTELASASEPVSVEAGNLKVTVFPGYIGVPDVGQQAVAEFEKDQAGVVMSTIPVQAIADSLGNASLGRLTVIRKLMENSLKTVT